MAQLGGKDIYTSIKSLEQCGLRRLPTVQYSVCVFGMWESNCEVLFSTVQIAICTQAYHDPTLVFMDTLGQKKLAHARTSVYNKFMLNIGNISFSNSILRHKPE